VGGDSGMSLGVGGWGGGAGFSSGGGGDGGGGGGGTCVSDAHTTATPSNTR